MNKIIVVALALLTLSGCASRAERDHEFNIEQAVINAQIARQTKPTLSISCTGGCKFDSLEYNDPNQKGPMLPHKTTGADVAIKALSVIGGAVMPVVAGQVLRGAFDSVGSTNNTTSNNTTTSTNNTTSTNTTADSYNQTATPTVVNQPDPVIVDPVIVVVDPVVVDPVVVDPVIVDPVVVDPAAPDV